MQMTTFVLFLTLVCIQVYGKEKQRNHVRGKNSVSFETTSNNLFQEAPFPDSLNNLDSNYGSANTKYYHHRYSQYKYSSINNSTISTTSTTTTGSGTNGDSDDSSLFDHDDDVAEDDDRHIKEPGEYNSTNGPAGIISRIPSTPPTSYPSSLPSAFPSYHPTVQPSYHPSSNPSISAAPSTSEPCTSHNPFNFGITKPKDGYSNFTTSMMNFQYDLESNEQIAQVMGDTIMHQTKAVEMKLLDLLTKLYFPECSDATNVEERSSRNTLGYGEDLDDQQYRNNIFRPIRLSSSSRNQDDNFRIRSGNQTNASKLIGMSAKPFDVASGEKCNNLNNRNDPTSSTTRIDNPISCHIIDGRFSLYYYIQTTNDPIENSRRQQSSSSKQTQPSSNTSSRSRHVLEQRTQSESKQSSMMKSIQQIMDDGLLNTCHPAIISVKFRNLTIENTFTNLTDDARIDDDQLDIMTPIQLMNTVSWIALGSSIFIFVSLLLTRYKYYKHQLQQRNGHHKDDTGSATSEDAFFELDLDGGDDSENYAHQFDMVSSLTTMNRSGALSGSKSGSSPFPSPTHPTMFHKSIVRSSLFSSKSSSLAEKWKKTKKTRIRVKGKPPDPTGIVESSPSSSCRNSTDFSKGTGSDESRKSYIDSVQSETARLQAKLTEARKALDELATQQHENLRQYVEKAKENPSSETLRKARLALILLSEPEKQNETL